MLQDQDQDYYSLGSGLALLIAYVIQIVEFNITDVKNKFPKYLFNVKLNEFKN